MRMLKRPLLAAVPAVLAVLLNACSSGGSSAVQSLPKAPQPGGDVLPTPAPPAGAASQSTGIPQNSPYVRVNPDGTVLHIDPLPQLRPAYSLTQPSSPNVDYHGGKVIDKSVAYAIFWRPAGYYMSPKYEPVIEQFYHDIGSTPMYAILPQYYDKDG